MLDDIHPPSCSGKLSYGNDILSYIVDGEDALPVGYINLKKETAAFSISLYSERHLS